MRNNNLILKDFLDNAFNLKSHLMEFFSMKESDLDGFLTNAKMNLANLHPGDALSNVSDFYTEIVGERHVADLAAWHITSKSYIADTLKLQQRFSKDLVLDFTYRLTEPLLFHIRRFLPNLGAFDISPIILLLLIWFVEVCMKLYLAPILF